MYKLYGPHTAGLSHLAAGLDPTRGLGWIGVRDLRLEQGVMLVDEDQGESLREALCGSQGRNESYRLGGCDADLEANVCIIFFGQED